MLCVDYCGLSDIQTPAYFAFPTFDGNAVARVYGNTGIRGNSKNKTIAYALLKMLLSDNVQNGLQFHAVPVLKGG